MLSFRRTSSSLLLIRGAVSTRVATPQKHIHPSSMRFISIASSASSASSSPSLSKGATSFRRKLGRTPEYGEAILSSPAIHHYFRSKRDGEGLSKVLKREHGGHSHAAAALAQSGDEAQTKSEFWVTWLGLASNLGFGAAKIAAGWAASSSALLADGFHMLGDMTSDVVTLATLKFARRPRSEKHPYGHGRFETVGTLFVSLLLSATGVGIAYHTIESLVPAALSGGIVEALNHTHTSVAGMGTTEGMIALGVSLLSIVCKEALFQVNMSVARKSGSQVLVANAWHHRTDALTSVMALIGVLGAQMGLPILDPVTGLMVAGLIVKTGASMTMESFRELTDEAIQPELIKEVEELATSVDGVQAVHNVRARKMGTYSLVDLHIQVDSKISVSAAHNVAERTRVAILLALPTVSEVLVHVDAEHDHPDPASFLTPANRQKLKVHSTPSAPSSSMEHAQEHPSHEHEHAHAHEHAHEHPSSETEELILPGRLMLSQSQVEKEVRSTLERLNGELIESGSNKTMKGVSEITCHYLDQQLNVELCVEVDPELKVKDAQHLARLTRYALEALPSVDKAHINLRLDDRYPCEKLSSSLPPLPTPSTTRKT